MADLSDPRTPTWPELQLDGYVSRLKVSLGVYFVSLVLFWMHVSGGAVWLGQAFAPFVYAALANYVFLVWTAYKIQQTLYDSGVYKHGGWHVWIGALLLNPAALGWFIPVSVLFTSIEMRRKLEARWPKGRVA